MYSFWLLLPYFNRHFTYLLIFFFLFPFIVIFRSFFSPSFLLHFSLIPYWSGSPPIPDLILWLTSPILPLLISIPFSHSWNQFIHIIPNSPSHHSVSHQHPISQFLFLPTSIPLSHSWAYLAPYFTILLLLPFQSLISHSSHFSHLLLSSSYLPPFPIYPTPLQPTLLITLIPSLTYSLPLPPYPHGSATPLKGVTCRFRNWVTRTCCVW